MENTTPVSNVPVSQSDTEKDMRFISVVGRSIFLLNFIILFLLLLIFLSPDVRSNTVLVITLAISLVIVIAGIVLSVRVWKNHGRIPVTELLTMVIFYSISLVLNLIKFNLIAVLLGVLILYYLVKAYRIAKRLMGASVTPAPEGPVSMPPANLS